MLLTETSKGCLLFPLWKNDATSVISWAQSNISENDLAEDGIEREPHVTVLYGFDPSFDPEAVCDALAGFGKVSFRLGKISRFEQKDYDVLKVDVESDSLHRLHSTIIDKFDSEIEQMYPMYTPHMTLAYVKKGTCKDMDGNCRFDGQTYVFDLAIYSTPDSKARYFVHLEA